MKCKARFLALSFVAMFIVSAISVQAQENEIRYDDGEWDTWYNWVPGCLFAVRFTPPYVPCQVTKVRYYIARDPATFIVRLFDSKKERLPFQELQVTPTSTGWFQVDLSPYNVVVDDDFYVAMEYSKKNKPCLGADEASPDDRSWLVWQDDTWQKFSTFAAQHRWKNCDFMIRASVIPIDSDGDGLYDHEETALGTDPKKADTDNDGLNDKVEKDLGTNPSKADTDGDGLSDGDEVNNYKTDPLKVDTDGDGLLDAEEVTKYQTDPLKTDTDGDGLTDKDEVLKGTNPLKVDSDGDGLNDADELSMKTDPLRADTDLDGLTDGEEIKKGADPLKPDTDGDGLTDGDEVKKGADPLMVDTDGDFLNDSIDPMPTNVFVPDILGLVIVAIVMVAVFVLRRKRKAAPPLPPTLEAPAVPPTPPTPVEAPAVPPVPTMKYCVHCGAQIPVESIYCGKCGGRQ